MKRKFRGKHGSVSTRLRLQLEWLLEQPGVKKVIIGKSVGLRHGKTPGTIIYKEDTTNGMKIHSIGEKGITEVFVCCDKRHISDILSKLERVSA